MADLLLLISPVAQWKEHSTETLAVSGFSPMNSVSGTKAASERCRPSWG
jgi:hypothetical protein